MGRASCVGGVRFAERAFAVGEWRSGFEYMGALTIAPDLTATIAAHELGHLMGAHHHFAVCGTGAANLARRRTDVCTVMVPEITPAGLEFSPINSAIVRGHAEKFTPSVKAPMQAVTN